MHVELITEKDELLIPKTKNLLGLIKTSGILSEKKSSYKSTENTKLISLIKIF